MDSEARRRTMGEAGRAYAHEHFGIDAMLDKMEAVFRTAADHARPGFGRPVERTT
jgi:hypothetical protein